MASVQNKIEKALQIMFNPVQLKVVNQSHLHAGHAGDDGSGESHFKIEIESDMFYAKTQIECHRMIFRALEESLDSLPHAVSIKVLHSPQE